MVFKGNYAESMGDMNPLHYLKPEIKLFLIVVLVAVVFVVSPPVFANGFPKGPPPWFSLIEFTIKWLFVVLILLATAMGIMSGLWIIRKKDLSIPKFLRFTVYVFLGFGITSILLFVLQILKDLYF